MKQLLVVLAALALVSVLSPAARANIFLNDFAVNVTGPGGFQADWQNLTDVDPTALPGMSSARAAAPLDLTVSAPRRTRSIRAWRVPTWSS